jgi:DDE_Tnp_1-associated/Transposase DDE domain
MEIAGMDAPSTLVEFLRQIPDPRRAEGKRHPLAAVLSLLVLAMMAGMRGLQGVVDFGRNLPPEVVAGLGFTRSRTLAKSTLSEILRAIDINAFESAVSRWLQGQADRNGWTAIAIDGKSLRGSAGDQLPAVHLVAGYAHEAQLVLAQLRVDNKTNEHKAALELLGLLPLEGAVVTADAMFTHADFCRGIHQAKGDYFLAVKENQPTLLRDIEAVFAAEANISPLPTAPARCSSQPGHNHHQGAWPT